MDTTNLVNCEVTTILNDASQISSSSSSVADADEDLISKLTQFESNLIGSNVIYYMIKRRVELDSKLIGNKYLYNLDFPFEKLPNRLAVFLKSVHDSADKKGKLEYFYATGNYLLYMFAKILRRLNNNSYDDKLKGIFLSKFNLRFEKRLENTLNASVDKQCVAIINDDEFTLNNFIEYLNLLSTNSSPSSSNNQKQQDFFNKFHRIIDNDFSQTLINDKLPIYINDEFMELSVYDYKGYKNKPLDDECFTKCLERQIILIGDSICICLENIYIYYNEKIENVYNDKSKMKGIYKKSKEEYKKLLSEETN
ncbi:12034_t:CDS:2 [Entrophospora sp. SA101]|nr:12034_t:CDS:2 [Entrophospora sp. SA101]